MPVGIEESAHEPSLQSSVNGLSRCTAAARGGQPWLEEGTNVLRGSQKAQPLLCTQVFRWWRALTLDQEFELRQPHRRQPPAHFARHQLKR